MNHPDDDRLLLHVFGELPEPEAAAAQRHLEGCAACRDRFRSLAEPAAALEWTRQHRAVTLRRAAWLVLPLAAAVGAVLLWPRSAAESAGSGWQPHLVASPVGGYVAGGPALMAIDSQLARLERGRPHGTRMD